MSISGFLGSLKLPAFQLTTSLRCFSTTPAVAINFPEGHPYRKKIDFGTLRLYNKRHLKEHKKELFRKFQSPNKHPNIPVHTYGCRGTGIRHHASWQPIPEKVPQLVVPDLTDCKLRPYVSYKTKEIYQEPLTSRDLFNAIYGHKMLKDFKEGKLDDEGKSSEPSEEEKLTPEEAWIQARKTGSDIFVGGVPVSPYFNIKYDRK